MYASRRTLPTRARGYQEKVVEFAGVNSFRFVNSEVGPPVVSFREGARVFRRVCVCVYICVCACVVVVEHWKHSACQVFA